MGFGVLDNFLDAHSGLNQLGPGASPLDIQGTFHGLTWDRIQDPLLAMGSLIDPGALLSSSLDKASPLRLSVVSLEDDQLRALADELRSMGETVLVLDPSREGLNDLARTLQQQGRHYNEIQIFGHGGDNNFRVGKNNLSTRTLWRYRDALEEIGHVISPGGDLLLYGCNLAEGVKGKQLIERLATITGADVAASTDLTYANGQNSDWDLEWSAGAIDNRPFHDVLTGLNWQGQLGGTASLSGSELRVTDASGVIGISRDAATGNILLSGTSQSSISNSSATVISKVSVTGKSFEVSGINLDRYSTDTLYPGAYDVVINATGSYDAGSTADSGNLTVSGEIRSFGGNVSLSSPGKITIRSTDTSAVKGLVDARAWSGSTATTTAGNLTIKFQSEGRDLPMMLWMPQVDVNLEVGNTSGTGKTQLFAKDVKITGSAAIASDLISNSSSNQGLTVLNELLDTAIYGLTTALSPLPATIKTGSTSTKVAFSNAELQASGSINLDLSSSLALKAPAYGSAWWQNSLLLWSAGVAVGSTTTDLDIKSSSLNTSGGDITIKTTSSNELSADSTLKINPGKSKSNPEEGSKENNNKVISSFGVTVCNTKSSITLDATSQIKATGSISIENTADPTAETTSAAVLFYGGRGSASASIGYDKTNATVQIDGLIQSEGQVYADPLPAATLFSQFWNYVQAGTGPNYTVTTPAGNAITAAVSINLGQVVRAANGDLFKFTGSNGTSLDLRTLNIATDNRFSVVGSSSFAVNENLKVGDEVKVENASSGYAFKVRALADGTKVIEGRNGIELTRTGSTDTFSVNPGDRILGDDGRHYLYRGSTFLSTTLDQLDPRGANWAIAPLLESGAVMQITAILDNSVAGKDYILATDQPLDLEKDQATGTNHGIYKVSDITFNASLSTSVDLANNEIILTAAVGSTRDAYGPGQPVRYYVLPDKASGQDSYPIGGLTGDTLYYLIPRGGDRFALALTPENALANRAIDLTQLGTGSQHLIHYDLGTNFTVKAQLQPLATGDYRPPSTPVAQVAGLILSGNYEVGDSVTITFQNQGLANTDPQELSYKATSSNITDIRNGIINLINSSSGIGTGTGSYLQAAAGTIAGVTAINLSAKTAGSPFLVIAAATNGPVSTNSDRTQAISVESLTQNVTPPNQLNQKLSLTGAPTGLGNIATVQLSSGLLQTSANALIGAQAFLTAADVLVNSAGTSLASTVNLTLQPGDVLYVETGTSTTTGTYRRYVGSAAWSGSASALRSALTSQSMNWLVGAGPLMELILPGTSTTDYRLQSTTQGTPSLNNGILSVSSKAGLAFVVQTPTVVFNPAISVDSANNILTLSGLGAATGDVISYRVDPVFTRTTNQSLFLPITANGIKNGSNIWSEVTLPSTAVSTSAGIYKLTYYSTNPLFGSTGRAPASDPMGGLQEGQVLYAKAGSTAGTINLFRDAAATQSLSLNTSESSANTTHYFKLDVNVQQPSQPVGGISPNDELVLIALGGDRYQLVEDSSALEQALPRTLLGRQISDTTRLSKVVDDEVAGIAIKSGITAENAVEAETSIGGEPALNDNFSNAGVSTLMAKGLQGVMDKLFQIDINPARSEVEQGSSISGAIALNLGEHIASIDQGSTGKIVAGASKAVNIGSSIEATFKNINKSETEHASSTAINVALGVNNLSNTAKNNLKGLIQTEGAVTLDANTEYPSLFMGTFGNSKKIGEWFQSPTNILDSLSDVTGVFVGESFNSFSQVRIAGKEENGKPKQY